MSLSVATDVHCDECGTWIAGVVETTKNGVTARHVARQHGWVASSRGDWCPTCIAAGYGEN